MSNFHQALRHIVAAACLAVASDAHAAFVVYTSQSAFNAATSAQGIDGFDGLSTTAITSSPLPRATFIGAFYRYTASTDGDFFGAGSSLDPWLSPNIALDSVTFGGFSPGISGIGGNFFGSDIDGIFQSGDILITAFDTEGSVAQTIVSATTSSFLGFVSTTSITSLVVSAVQPTAGGALWPAVDNLVLAQAPVIVPEPGTFALVFGALAAAGLAVRRHAS